MGVDIRRLDVVDTLSVLIFWASSAWIPPRSEDRYQTINKIILLLEILNVNDTYIRGRQTNGKMITIHRVVYTGDSYTDKLPCPELGWPSPVLGPLSESFP